RQHHAVEGEQTQGPSPHQPALLRRQAVSERFLYHRSLLASCYRRSSLCSAFRRWRASHTHLVLNAVDRRGPACVGAELERVNRLTGSLRPRTSPDEFTPPDGGTFTHSRACRIGARGGSLALNRIASNI